MNPARRAIAAEVFTAGREHDATQSERRRPGPGRAARRRLGARVPRRQRPEYPGYWRELRRVMAPGATLAIDNAISHESELTNFRRLLDQDAEVDSALVPIGAGLIVAVVGGRRSDRLR